MKQNWGRGSVDLDGAAHGQAECGYDQSDADTAKSLVADNELASSSRSPVLLFITTTFLV
jgi:hypothetical protein